MRVDAAAHDARQSAAGDRTQQASQADDRIDALGLRDGVDLADDEPELHRRERAHEPRPDIKGPERPGAERRADRPERERPGGAHGQEGRERARAAQSACGPLRQPDRDARPWRDTSTGAAKEAAARGTARRARFQGWCGRRECRRAPGRQWPSGAALQVGRPATGGASATQPHPIGRGKVDAKVAVVGRVCRYGPDASRPAALLVGQMFPSVTRQAAQA